ncbi:MAG: hypothetical protein WAO10_10505, partial [Candidatus Sulfotelmatobacter sp.]
KENRKQQGKCDSKDKEEKHNHRGPQEATRRRKEGNEKTQAGLNSDVLVANTATNTGTRLRCKFTPSPLFSRWLR